MCVGGLDALSVERNHGVGNARLDGLGGSEVRRQRGRDYQGNVLGEGCFCLRGRGLDGVIALEEGLHCG